MYQHFINYNNIKTNRIYTAGYNPYTPVQANLDIKIEGTNFWGNHKVLYSFENYTPRSSILINNILSELRKRR